MDTAPLLLLLSFLIMLWVTWHAHRLGNERRDVKLLGGLTAALGAGAAVSAVV
jgi:hypothetical protein